MWQGDEYINPSSHQIYTIVLEITMKKNKVNWKQNWVQEGCLFIVGQGDNISLILWIALFLGLLHEQLLRWSFKATSNKFT